MNRKNEGIKHHTNSKNGEKGYIRGVGSDSHIILFKILIVSGGISICLIGWIIGTLLVSYFNIHF